jgi:hypothetical protein
MIYNGNIQLIDANLYEAFIYNNENTLVYSIIGSANDNIDFQTTYTQFICDQLSINNINWI